MEYHTVYRTIPVIKRFNSLLSLSPTEFSRIREPEKRGSKLNQPFWIDGCCLSHVFFGR